MHKKIGKEVTDKLDVRVEPTDLASPRLSHETEEPEAPSARLRMKNRP